ncbi:unnamed protein product [Linum trigynum]|uniref:Uncharacterized protein n=1 Tax=Linum trigynum TaxID=586398 RepID=A0AAV2FPZ0_9ROSI
MFGGAAFQSKRIRIKALPDSRGVAPSRVAGSRRGAGEEEALTQETGSRRGAGEKEEGFRVEARRRGERGGMSKI